MSGSGCIAGDLCLNLGLAGSGNIEHLRACIPRCTVGMSGGLDPGGGTCQNLVQPDLIQGGLFIKIGCKGTKNF